METPRYSDSGGLRVAWALGGFVKFQGDLPAQPRVKRPSPLPRLLCFLKFGLTTQCTGMLGPRSLHF